MIWESYQAGKFINSCTKSIWFMWYNKLKFYKIERMELASLYISIYPFSTCLYPILFVTGSWNRIYCLLMVWYHCFLHIVMSITIKHFITAYRKLCSQLDWSVPNRLLPMPSDRQHRVFLGLHLKRVQKILF